MSEQNEQDALPLGALIRLARERERLTQEGFADKAGLSRTYVSDIERGRHPTSIKQAQRLLGLIGWELTLGIRKKSET